MCALLRLLRLLRLLLLRISRPGRGAPLRGSPTQGSLAPAAHAKPFDARTSSWNACKDNQTGNTAPVYTGRVAQFDFSAAQQSPYEHTALARIWRGLAGWCSLGSVT